MPRQVTFPDEENWSVLLYRRESDGWKKQELESPTSSIQSRRKLRTHARITTAAPRENSIVFPDLRQKFSLKNPTDHGTVIRRDDKILLTSKRRARSLLLQFKSLEDCLSFSDRFIRLNPRLPKMPMTGSSVSSSKIHSQFDSQKGGKKGDSKVDHGNSEVISWVVRMLHDETFLSYVDKIENYISNTEDGSKILDGLKDRKLS